MTKHLPGLFVAFSTLGFMIALFHGWFLVGLVFGFAGLLVFAIPLIFEKRRNPPAVRKFKDTPEAWQARKAIPGETREQARQRLEQYRE